MNVRVFCSSSSTRREKVVWQRQDHAVPVCGATTMTTFVACDRRSDEDRVSSDKGITTRELQYTRILCHTAFFDSIDNITNERTNERTNAILGDFHHILYATRPVFGRTDKKNCLRRHHV